MDSDGDYILIDEGSIDFYEIGTYLIECIMELEDGCIIDVKAEINVNAPIYV